MKMTTDRKLELRRKREIEIERAKRRYASELSQTYYDHAKDVGRENGNHGGAGFLNGAAEEGEERGVRGYLEDMVYDAINTRLS